MDVTIDVETKVSQSVRAQQLSSMFDVPAQTIHQLHWEFAADLEANDWTVGLIVGPSGSGKTTILRHMFGDPLTFEWLGASVVDDFSDAHSVDAISRACSAVGFNTIPAWLRPYDVLSTGEQFRVTMARAVLDTSADKPVVIDEFTSVVDRQVAQIGSHAVQKWVRRAKPKKQFVAATCHYDVIDWLQPDWVIDAAQQTFVWRSVQPRPTITGEIRAVPYELWNTFAPFHYLTATLNHTARCYALFVDDQPVTFAGVLHRVHPHARNIMGISRLVTLPDWQGLALAFVMAETLGAAYRRVGQRLRTYPAHPAFIRGFDKSDQWALKQKPGYQSQMGFTRSDKGFGTRNTTRERKPDEHRKSSRQAGWIATGDLSRSVGWVPGPNAKRGNAADSGAWKHGSRPCAVFEYVGDAWSVAEDAVALINDAHGSNALRPVTI